MDDMPTQNTPPSTPKPAPPTVPLASSTVVSPGSTSSTASTVRGEPATPYQQTRNMVLLIGLVVLLCSVLASVVTAAGTAAYMVARNNDRIDALESGSTTRQQPRFAPGSSQPANPSGGFPQSGGANPSGGSRSPTPAPAPTLAPPSRNAQPTTQPAPRGGQATAVPTSPRRQPTPQAPGGNTPGSSTEGALVQSVVSGGPADKAGLRTGDVITQVGDVSIDPDHSLADAIGEYRPGDQVQITYMRNGSQRTANVTLDSNPQNPDRPYLGVQYSATQP